MTARKLIIATATALPLFLVSRLLLISRSVVAKASFFGLDDSLTTTNFCCPSCVQESQELSEDGSSICCCSKPASTDWTVRQNDFLCRVLREFSWKYYDSATYGEPAESYLDVVRISTVIREFRLDALSGTENCLGGNLMALLLSAEHAGRSIWPLIRTPEDYDTLLPTLLLAKEYYAFAFRQRNAFQQTDLTRYENLEAEWPILHAMLFISGMFNSIDSKIHNHGALSNVDPHEYRFSHLLGPFADVVVHPTNHKIPIYYQAGTAAEEPTATPAQRAEAFHHAVSVFEELKIEYIPMAGTLIGLLRYGSTVGELPGGRYDVVDIDFDFWLHVPFEQRIPLASKIFERLEKFGWTRC